MRHAREWNGRCLDCQDEARAGGDLPICQKAEPAAAPLDEWCAWCGHEVRE